MKKIVSLLLIACILLSTVSVLAEKTNSNDEKNISGECKPMLALDYSASLLFSKPSVYPMIAGIIITSCQDRMGVDGPLNFNLVKVLYKTPSWLGLTNDNKKLILIGYYNEQQSIIVFEFDPKGRIRYNATENTYSSNSEFVNALPELFSQQNVTDYYEVSSEDVVTALEKVGCTKLRDWLKE